MAASRSKTSQPRGASTRLKSCRPERPKAPPSDSTNSSSIPTPFVTRMNRMDRMGGNASELRCLL